MRRLNLQSQGSKAFKRIIVDLTPVRPGGENGGAKLLATELVRQFSRSVAPEYEYILLTSSDTHEELSWLDAPNVIRLCVNERQAAKPTMEAATISLPEDLMPPVDETISETVAHKQNNQQQNRTSPKPARRLSIRKAINMIGKTLENYLPRSIYGPLYRFYRTHIKALQTRDQLRGLEVDLIFCPFTAPLYQQPGIPILIVVHDLQYQTYPQFFSSEDLYHLDHYFRQSCQVAAKLICVSEYTREKVLTAKIIPPERVVTIPSSLFNQLETVSTEVTEEILKKHDLQEDSYLLYPANFWPHKNHEMLLVAFSMFLARHTETELKLILTGAPGDRMTYLKQATEEMGLKDKVLYPGFVPVEEYSALLQGCLAVIFPSLYEGFGAPVIEAMAFNKPVLCSNSTSLPEVTQSAAHLFDPRKPDEIAAAIEKIQEDAKCRKELISRGKQRVINLASPTDWASAYFEVFRQVMGENRITSNAVYGIHPDHWAGDTLEITVVTGDGPCYLELTLRTPPWLPKSFLYVRVKSKQGKSRTFRIARGSTETLRVPIQIESIKLSISFSPTVSPLKLGLSQDSRLLSCQVLACQLVTSQYSEFLYKADH